MKYSLSIDIILALAALLYFIHCSFEFLFDPDLFMLLRTGHEIIHHGFPYYDTFAWPPLSCKVPWIDYEWLSHVIIYIVYSAGGLTGTVIYKTFLYGVGFFVLFLWSMKKYGLRPALVALIIAIYLGRWFLSPRPMSYSAVMFPLLAFILLDLQQKPLTWKHFLLLPLMFVFWGNVHGAFVIGLVIMGAGFVLLSYLQMKSHGRWKRMLLQFALLWLLCFLASAFINPYGWNNLKYCMDFLFFRTVFINAASDMQPPFMRPAFNAHYFIITALTLVTLIFFLVRYRKIPSPMELFIYSVWLLASFRAARNMQLFSTASIPVLSFLILQCGTLLAGSRYYRRLTSFLARKPALPDTAKVVAVFTVLLLFIFSFTAVDFSGKASEKDLFPVGMKDFLLHNDLPGRLYCHDIVGTYFLWYLYPRYQVSLDVRWNNVYTDEYFKEIQSSFHDSDAFFRFVKKYDPDVVIVHYKYHPSFIENDPMWMLLYEGERSRLFLRKNEKNSAIIEKFKRDELWYPDIPDVNAFLFRTFIEIKNYDAAKKYLKRLILASPYEKELWYYYKELDRLIENRTE
ncbi:MAG: hypothetical protein AB2L14_07515 [Candidatus Xenobiia bacterium LiM19]